MQFEEYALFYREFHKEFFPLAGIKDKRNKLIDETYELQTSVINHEHNPVQSRKDAVIDETIDTMNTAIAYLLSEGILDPLDAGYRKLQKTAEKYRAQNAV